MGGIISGLARFLLGLLIGAAVGAVVASLVAPSSGDDLKRLLRQRLDTIRAAGDAAASQAEEKLRREFEQRVTSGQ